MTIERQVELFYDAMKHEYVSYVDDVLKIVAFLLASVGWLLTSDDARNALSKDDPKMFVLTILALLTVNIFLVLYGHFLRSVRLQKRLLQESQSLQFLADNYVIRGVHLAVNIIAIGALLILLAAIVWSVRE